MTFALGGGGAQQLWEHADPDGHFRYRHHRIKVAERFGITPAEVDEMPFDDVQDAYAVWAAEEEAKAAERERQQMQATLEQAHARHFGR